MGNGSHEAGQVIRLCQDTALKHIGNEAYHLDVSPAEISIRAAGQAGIFYGIQTLRQLLPPEVFSGNVVSGIVWNVPCVTIRDVPRFAWRGLMLDTGHDFQHLALIFHFIELMALHKFNTLHWHITDLGTWPLEIKGYPRLVDPSTRGKRMMGDPKRGVKPGFYTQDQVRQVVRFAAERHITVVPEIDMPGHSTPALIAYPELDCPVPGEFWGFDRWEYCVANEKTYSFLQEVLSQVMEVFPSKLIHIGGDECPKDHWLKCPACQARMQAESLKTGEELQSYFTRRIGKFLESRGRRLVGWDEILEGGVDRSAVVMAWRAWPNAPGSAVAAAKAGHDVVMAPTTHTYFDYPEATTPLEKVYSFEPVPESLDAGEAKHILGAQAQMWTDHHPTWSEIENLVYPRACALAEVVWTPAVARDFSAFIQRLGLHVRRLAAMGVNYRPVPDAPAQPPVK